MVRIDYGSIFRPGQGLRYKVNHQKLIVKLENAGIEGSLLIGLKLTE